MFRRVSLEMQMYLWGCKLTESPLLFYSFAGIHILDVSAVWPVHHALCFGHYRVPLRAVPTAWTHVGAVTSIQEAQYKKVALLCCTSWHFVTW